MGFVVADGFVFIQAVSSAASLEPASRLKQESREIGGISKRVVVCAVALLTSVPALSQGSAAGGPLHPVDPNRSIACIVYEGQGNSIGDEVAHSTKIAPSQGSKFEVEAKLLQWARAKGIKAYNVYCFSDLTQLVERSLNGRVRLEGRTETRYHGTGSDYPYQMTFKSITPPEGWWKPGWNPAAVVAEKPGNFETSIKRTTIGFKSHRTINSIRTPEDEGYQDASIDVAYRFMICAGEVHFAYSLDRSSLRHNVNYDLMPLEPGQLLRTVQPDTKPPAPDTFSLEATISTYPADRLVAYVKDAIAGEALGIGCFTGQSKKLGTVAQLVGTSATPSQAKAYLESLRLKRIADIPFSLRHPRPEDAAARAARKAASDAQLQQSAAAKLNAALKSGQTSIPVDAAGEYTAMSRLIGEYNASTKAAYEAEMARHRAAVAASVQARARYLAETVPCPANDGTRCRPPAKK